MPLTAAQLPAFKAAILAETDPTLVALRTENNEPGMADWYNAASTTYVWRRDVSRADVYNTTTGEGTTWNWTTYKAQAVPEQGAWTQMFMGDRADFSNDNLRSGVAAIFGNSNAQTTHILAVGKRLARRVEKIFATGTGTLAAPAKLVYEGTVTAQTVSDALRAV